MTEGMKAERYKGVLLYSDLDGTLLDPDRTLSPDNLGAIAHFISCGGRFGVANVPNSSRHGP